MQTRPVAVLVLASLLAQCVGCGAPVGGERARVGAPSYDGEVNVHLATANAVLESRVPGTSAWTAACSTPCDIDVARMDEYRITQNGVPVRLPFTLDAPSGSRVTVDVNSSTEEKSSTSPVLVVLGAVGLLVLVAGYIGLKAVAGGDE